MKGWLKTFAQFSRSFQNCCDYTRETVSELIALSSHAHTHTAVEEYFLTVCDANQNIQMVFLLAQLEVNFTYLAVT